MLKYEIDRLRNLAMTLDTDRVILTPIRQTRGTSRQDLHPDNYEDFRRAEDQTSKY